MRWKDVNFSVQLKNGELSLLRYVENHCTYPMLTSETTYTQARENLASLLDRVVDDQEIVVIKRGDRPSIALIAESELSSLLETVYLLRSPENALRLFAALEWSKSNDEKPGVKLSVEQAIEQLKEKLGIVEEEAS